MKRLVYAPQVNVWVKSDTGIFDLSSYVTSFNVHRRVNAVSAAEVTFRNPKVEGPDGEPRFMFTQHPVSNEGKSISYEPMFHPMDPIIITLTRLKGYPVQVFTGYCDTTPYVQMYPGTAKITASCTLKRLKYTYWDPGLPFVYEYLAALGWVPGKDGGLIFNPSAEAVTTATGDLGYDNLTDSSFGHLVYRILQDVGGWNHNDIYVQGLPAEAIDKIVDGIYNDLTGDAKANFKDVSKFLKRVIGTTTVGGAVSGGGVGSTGNGGSDTAPPGGGGQPASVGYPLAIRGTLGSTVADHKNRPLGNWQSDNALDISVPVGTSEFAVDDGTIVRVKGSYTNGTGLTEGLRFTLITKDNEWFYQHSSQRFVSEGQKVKKGDLLAKTGAGNSVAHLHIASKFGDPQVLLGL